MITIIIVFAPIEVNTSFLLLSGVDTRIHERIKMLPVPFEVNTRIYQPILTVFTDHREVNTVSIG